MGLVCWHVQSCPGKPWDTWATDLRHLSIVVRRWPRGLSVDRWCWVHKSKGSWLHLPLHWVEKQLLFWLHGECRLSCFLARVINNIQQTLKPGIPECSIILWFCAITDYFPGCTFVMLLRKILQLRKAGGWGVPVGFHTCMNNQPHMHQYHAI